MIKLHDEEEGGGEPVRGLPQALPEGEQLLWQGSHGTLAFAIHAFHTRFVLAYFVLATSWRLANLETALLVRELHPTQRVVVRLGESDLAETLRNAAGIRHAVAIPNLAAPAFAAALFGDRVQAVFLIAGRLFAAIEIHVEPGETELLTVPVGELMKRFGMILISLQPARPDPNTHVLSSGDRLTVIAALADLDRFYRRGA